MSNREKEPDLMSQVDQEIRQQMGKTVTDRNVDYIMSLYEARLMSNGEIDDDIPVPTDRAFAKTLTLMFNHQEVPWSEAADKFDVKYVFEYLFIRARNHYDEVYAFLRGFLNNTTCGLHNKMVVWVIDLLDKTLNQECPNRFAMQIIYPEHADRILATLHQFTMDETGKGLALVMRCAKEEGLIRNNSYGVIAKEFPHADKSSYNKYLNSLDTTFTDKEIEIVKCNLRSRIGYTRKEDGTLKFGFSLMSPRNFLISLVQAVRSWF